MSSVYNLEPPTDGKVVLHTSYGDIDIELWPREAPLACRNFVQLALEGYYDQTIFHRIIKNFMIQGGDPTGVGDGGESSYDGKPFRDEFHSRLKFNHRGVLAMANANEVDANGSQFFVTLDSCEWLNKKHTIFGKVVGNTVFNLLRMGDLDVDAGDRPHDPPRLESVEVLTNPFDDVEPRAGKGKGAAGVAAAETEASKRKKSRKKVNDRSLLSFGDDDEEGDDAGSLGLKMTSMHDSAAAPERLLKEVAPEVADAAQATAPALSATKGGADGDVAPKRTEAELRAALRLAVASAEGRGAGGAAKGAAGEEDDADYLEMQERMKQQQRLRQKKLGGSKASRSAAQAAAGEAEEEFAAAEAEADADSAAARAAATRSEYHALVAEMKAGSKAGKAAKVMAAQKEASVGDALMTPLEQQRAKFLSRNRDTDLGERQKGTLAALEAFSKGLKGSGEGSGKDKKEKKEKKRSKKHTKEKRAREAGGDSVRQAAGVSDVSDESGSEGGYRGQVTQGDALFGHDSDDEGGGWFGGPLKFKKHTDDAFRGGDGRHASDYEVWWGARLRVRGSTVGLLQHVRPCSFFLLTAALQRALAVFAGFGRPQSRLGRV
jgi:peptidyl-prolyl cis-trans isomerase SDCCAG10